MHPLIAPPPPVAPPSRNTPEPPLLPPILSGPMALLWLWALPLTVLLVLNAQAYSVIAGNLSPEQHTRVLLFGWTGVANLAVGLALFAVQRWGGWNRATGAVADMVVSVMAVAVQVAYLWVAVASVDHMLPASVRSWIYPETRFFSDQFSFAMLPLFLGVLRVACLPTSVGIGCTVAASSVLLIGAPIALYATISVVGSMRSAEHVSSLILTLAVVTIGVLVFVALIRTLMYGLRGAQRWGAKAERIAIGLIAAALPTAGLLLNAGIPFPVDFQAWEVYALVGVNTGVLLLASWQHARRPRLSFCLLCATLPFSLYFFLVFLPYAPLAVLAMLAMGLGSLILAPTALFVLHLYLLNKSRLALRSARASQWITGGVLSFLLLPACFNLRALADRAALRAALDYVYAPAVTTAPAKYPGNLANLRRALHSHRSYKTGIYYPVLSDYYSWVVFDRLVLPDGKLAELEQTFLGAGDAMHAAAEARDRRNVGFGTSSVRARSRMPVAAPPSRAVRAEKVEMRTRAAGEQNTIATLALTLHNLGQVPAEYVRTLPLPPGVFVAGLRLEINGVLVPGRIFEKSTAQWVYAMIRDSERRDPALLVYNTEDQLELRVFPVAVNVPSRVEIDFLVPTPLTGALDATMLPDAVTKENDSTTILTGIGRGVRPQFARDRHGSFLALGVATAELPLVERETYLHVIVDRSRDNAFTGDLTAAVRDLGKIFPAARTARVTLAHHDAVDVIAQRTPLAAIRLPDDEALDRTLPMSGSLNLDFALARAIRRHRDDELDARAKPDGIPPRPVFVVLGRDATARKLELRMAEHWTDVLPEIELHEFDRHGRRRAHRVASKTSAPLLRFGNSIRPVAASRAVRFDETDSRAIVEYWSPRAARWLPLADVTVQSDTPWASAASLHLQHQHFVRSPGDAPVDRSALVAASRASGILLDVASYIVVENAAQWRMLELSERRKLGQNAELAFLEAPAPSAILIVLGFVGWIGWRRRFRYRMAGRGYRMADTGYRKVGSRR